MWVEGVQGDEGEGEGQPLDADPTASQPAVLAGRDSDASDSEDALSIDSGASDDDGEDGNVIRLTCVPSFHLTYCT